ncbi:hypothetical protein HC891_15040 [Candidatus Gracilibacteria bacterium]|nr:hypothetical protein [Candidatus Gracilibacteria bacterium]
MTELRPVTREGLALVLAIFAWIGLAMLMIASQIGDASTNISIFQAVLPATVITAATAVALGVACYREQRSARAIAALIIGQAALLVPVFYAFSSLMQVG